MVLSDQWLLISGPPASLMFLRKNELNLSGRVSRRSGVFTEVLRYLRERPDLMAILLMLFLSEHLV